MAGALRAALILGVFVHRSGVVVKFVVKIEKDIEGRRDVIKGGGHVIRRIDANLTYLAFP